LSVEFARFDRDHLLHQRRELFKDAFPEHNEANAASIEHYDWKFHGAPNVPQSYEYAAIADGKLVGYYAALPYPYMIDGRAKLAGMVCDVMTHSGARGQGIFTQLGQFALDSMYDSSLDFVTGYPVRPEVMGGHLRCGWQVAFKLPMYIRPIKANTLLASNGLSSLAPFVNAGLTSYRMMRGLRRKSEAYACSSGEPFELLGLAEFQDFLGGWSKSVKNHLVKSPEFYRWRLGAPGAQYRLFLAHSHRSVVAAAVGRYVTLRGIPSLALLDVMALEGQQRALPVLYRYIEREAKVGSAEAIVTMMSSHSAKKYRLIGSGFVRSPFTFRLIIRSVSDAVMIEEIANESDWHLMWIDSDDL
jgi:GNAT superfamily N-acetyltransferase